MLERFKHLKDEVVAAMRERNYAIADDIFSIFSAPATIQAMRENIDQYLYQGWSVNLTEELEAKYRPVITAYKECNPFQFVSEPVLGLNTFQSGWVIFIAHPNNPIHYEGKPLPLHYWNQDIEKYPESLTNIRNYKIKHALHICVFYNLDCVPAQQRQQLDIVIGF